MTKKSKFECVLQTHTFLINKVLGLPASTGLICSRSTQFSILSFPLAFVAYTWSKNDKRKQFHLVNRLSPEESYSVQFTINNTKQSKGKNKDVFLLPLSLGNTARHPSTGAPSVESGIQQAGQEKGGPREYTHTHMGVHLDIKERGRIKWDVTRPTFVVSQVGMLFI